MNKRRWLWRLAWLPVGWLVIVGAIMLLSRRPDNLGVVDGRLAACPSSPNCVCTQAADPQHSIAPLTFADEPAAAWERLKRAVAAQPRTKIVTDRPDYLHVEFTTAWLRFVDDVEFLLDAPNKTVHFRSASRLGHSDLGVNRRRMEAIRAKFAE